MGNRTKTDLSKRKLRSAISNGTSVLADVDHRGAEMRRLKDLIADHVSDLGGDERITHSERVLVHRASMLTLLCEMQERQLALDDFKITRPTDHERYLHAVGLLARLINTLGLQRRAKPVPSLQEYLRSKAASEVIDDDVTEPGP